MLYGKIDLANAGTEGAMLQAELKQIPAARQRLQEEISASAVKMYVAVEAGLYGIAI